MALILIADLRYRGPSSMLANPMVCFVALSAPKQTIVRQKSHVASHTKAKVDSKV